MKKIICLEDFVKCVGVLVFMVFRVLNDSFLVNMCIKQVIWKLVWELDYLFWWYMLAGFIGVKVIIFIVVFKFQDWDVWLFDLFFFELLVGVGDVVCECDCDIYIFYVMLGNYDDLVVLMMMYCVDGVIFVGQSILYNVFNWLVEIEGCFVVWGVELFEQWYCCVGLDNVFGGCCVVVYLVWFGCK